MMVWRKTLQFEVTQGIQLAAQEKEYFIIISDFEPGSQYVGQKTTNKTLHPIETGDMSKK